MQRPHRQSDSHPLQVYAVYAIEVDPPEDEDLVSWMLLTSAAVTTVEMVQTILRGYTYRWRVEDYHKLLQLGTQVERLCLKQFSDFISYQFSPQPCPNTPKIVGFVTI